MTNKTGTASRLATVPLSAPKITRRETMIDSLVVSYAALS